MKNGPKLIIEKTHIYITRDGRDSTDANFNIRYYTSNFRELSSRTVYVSLGTLYQMWELTTEWEQELVGKV